MWGGGVIPHLTSAAFNLGSPPTPQGDRGGGGPGSTGSSLMQDVASAGGSVPPLPCAITGDPSRGAQAPPPHNPAPLAPKSPLFALTSGAGVFPHGGG